jgi:hypothetical protein
MLLARKWKTSNHVARQQFDVFHSLSDQVNLTPDDRRRALNLTDTDWHAWQAFLDDGPIPSRPPLPDILCRLGQVAFNLSLVAETARHQALRTPAPCRTAQTRA